MKKLHFKFGHYSHHEHYVSSESDSFSALINMFISSLNIFLHGASTIRFKNIEYTRAVIKSALISQYNVQKFSYFGCRIWPILCNWIIKCVKYRTYDNLDMTVKSLHSIKLLIRPKLDRELTTSKYDIVSEYIILWNVKYIMWFHGLYVSPGKYK